MIGRNSAQEQPQVTAVLGDQIVARRGLERLIRLAVEPPGRTDERHRDLYVIDDIGIVRRAIWRAGIGSVDHVDVLAADTLLEQSDFRVEPWKQRAQLPAERIGKG